MFTETNNLSHRHLWALVATLGLVTGCEDTKPKSLEDCLIQGLKGVTSDQAAKTITYACTQKFPKPEKAAMALDYTALAKLKAEFRPIGGTMLDGSLYNGNQDLQLSTVNVSVRVSTNGPGSPEVWSQEYKIDLYCPPQKSAYTTIHLGRQIGNHKVEYYIVSATGSRE